MIVNDLCDTFGIYQILNKKTLSVYIGSTGRNFNRRWKQWRYSLKNNRAQAHKHLQNAWNKYGEESFEFSVLEIVEDISLLISREQYWINTFDKTHKIYNSIKTIGKSRINCKDKKSKLISEDKFSEIKSMYLSGLSLKSIAQKFNCSITPIREILISLEVNMRNSHDFIYNEESKQKMRISHLGKVSPKLNKRQIRLCFCGKPVTEYYRKDKFSGYNKTCGQFECIKKRVCRENL